VPAEADIHHSKEESRGGIRAEIRMGIKAFVDPLMLSTSITLAQLVEKLQA
jgi:hypothetical protein